jgi:hypothetical protein
LQVEVTRAREAVATVEAAWVTAILAAETSAQEAAAARDSTAIRVKDADNPAALVERGLRRGC